MRNEVQLIAYADRLGATIEECTRLVREFWGDAVGGVHLLPFFTPHDGADAGFDPRDHAQVDPRLGDWDDVRELARTHDVVVDVIVNHVSSSSAQFTDYLERGDESRYADMFLTFGTVFPNGATERDLTAIYRPRPGLPFTPHTVAGERRLAWTTFTPEQIDIDVRSTAGREYLDHVLDTLADAGVTTVRLDAAGYAIKTPGTSCFMTPETYAFIDDFTGAARRRGMDVLVEIHSHFETQIEIAARVDRVYDFALPPLLLYATYTRDLAPLHRWLEARPANAVTVLDTHDGIGVIDVGPDSATGRPGLLTAPQLDALVEGIHAASGGTSRLATGAAASNLDLYQVNCTYYAALGADDRAYLLARAIQFFAPGIPQVYYVGALAGDNDITLLHHSGVGRDINRHRYGPDEARTAADQPVARALASLMRLRSTHPAFNGTFTVSGTGDFLAMEWASDEHHARLEVDSSTWAVTLTWTIGSDTQAVTDLLTLAER